MKRKRTDIVCYICGTNYSQMPLKQALEGFLSCINCIADVHMAGGWTGHGLQGLKELEGRFGKATCAEMANEIEAARAMREKGE